MIKDVSDTSAWVTYYRVLETQRKDAIFKDPYAKDLLGSEHAEAFAKAHTKVNRWTNWTVVMRTYIIDQMIRDLIARGVTTFINMGAGLDSRPYRMNLDAHINWVEIDFPHIIEHKSKVLGVHTPTCKLERVGMDLANREERRKLLETLASKNERIVVLTEGVLPYLTELQVAELSEDLQAFKSFQYWICEYISPMSYKFLQNPKQMKGLKNSPFQFFPENWRGFFESKGWKLNQERFYYELSEELKRPTPFPLIFKLVAAIKGKEWARPFRKMSGYLLWERDSQEKS
ncbi:SAM-dependent methyltransferase [Bacteriovorax stolpii]|uniref:S-adenosyl-L-methionine-dependent methyltransferase n=1 Tax=Bacteriovorax stolpii TaxID=960 RepID=A0A2K9NW06_BACTC|nr:SAM-dependent methyltransferase [Bacteriovorax stolpii]AUN98944.1 SAM-dependent methyltransferase [Bacteriovorax stolpii]TDP55533.1 methyltransferase (TIGR00027 family) [Bacteriovorax stolpii]